MIEGWKVFAHDRCSPVQGGAAVWDGTLPFELPPVQLDDGPDECAAGWNFTRELQTALRIAGLWPTGRPSLLVRVRAEHAIERGDKCRAATLTLERLATDTEVADAIRALSAVFSPHVEHMAEEQLAWRSALARPRHDGTAVEDGLRRALSARGLDWELKVFPGQMDASRSGWDAWDARGGWDARAAWGAWAAWFARASWAARDAWAARASWAARDAWAALTVTFAALQGWADLRPDLLSEGLRDAYAAGLEIAIPTGPNELGYALVTP